MNAAPLHKDFQLLSQQRKLFSWCARSLLALHVEKTSGERKVVTCDAVDAAYPEFDFQFENEFLLDHFL